MDPVRHYRFDDLQLERMVAHDGRGEILTAQVLNARESRACNFIDMTVVPPGATIGVHTHEPDNEEVYIVISGRGRMHVDGADFDVAAGDVIANRPGGTHGLENTGGEDLRLVVIEMPLTR